MRQVEPSQEERLRKENEDLKRQLQELRAPAHGGPPAKLWRPSGVTIGALVLAMAVLIAVAFFAGYIPLRKQRTLIESEAREQETALPRVDVIEVGRSADKSGLE